MSINTSVRIQDHFEELTDPRRRKITYPPMNVVVIAVFHLASATSCQS